MLTLRDATNCRTGPGLAYEIIVTYPINQTLEIVGRYEPGNFWLVKSSESPTGICWLWGEYADVAGIYRTVPMAAAPPPTPLASVTPRPSRPQAPSLQEFKFYCDSVNNTFTEMAGKWLSFQQAPPRTLRPSRCQPVKVQNTPYRCTTPPAQRRCR
jgi:hypothetical protein